MYCEPNKLKLNYLERIYSTTFDSLSLRQHHSNFKEWWRKHHELARKTGLKLCIQSILHYYITLKSSFKAAKQSFDINKKF